MQSALLRAALLNVAFCVLNSPSALALDPAKAVTQYQQRAWTSDQGLPANYINAIVHGRDGGASGRAVGLRADMDALPIQEINTFAHRSRHAGSMHACGHDGHTAMLLAAAQHLARHRHFDGTVYLVFQPAEEGGGGAREMMKDGLFERFPMEAIFEIGRAHV